MRWMGIVAAAISVLVLACSGSPEPSGSPTTTEAEPSEVVTASRDWSRVAQDDLSEDQQAQRVIAMKARDELMGSLLGELEAALDEGGPEQAIGVCQVQAPAIAASVSANRSVAIGRTSHRLRNPDNQPPEWAADLVAERADQPVFLTGPDGELAAFLPIRLKPECQMCHGTAEHIAEDVAAAIARDYPQDEAVGFEPGDLRGWLWVEVPPQDTVDDGSEV